MKSTVLVLLLYNINLLLKLINIKLYDDFKAVNLPETLVSR